MYKQMRKRVVPVFVAIASIIAIVVILVIRGGVSDGLRYLTSNNYVILGCKLDLNASTNDLVLENIEDNKISTLAVHENVYDVCVISNSEVESFQIIFYKRYLISLIVDGEVVLSREEGLQAYKASTSLFIIGIVFFNLISGLLILISNSVRNKS